MADDTFTFDGSGLEGLANDLRGAARSVRRQVDVTLLEIGTEITAEAKVIASRHSKTIAGTIKMRAIPGAVIISGGSDQVPIAALYEVGNKKSSATATTFKHPVFGNREVWVEQPKHMYLRPALAADRRGITRRMESTWDRVLAPHRLKPI